MVLFAIFAIKLIRSWTISHEPAFFREKALFSTFVKYDLLDLNGPESTGKMYIE